MQSYLKRLEIIEFNFSCVVNRRRVDLKLYVSLVTECVYSEVLLSRKEAIAGFPEGLEDSMKG